MSASHGTPRPEPDGPAAGGPGEDPPDHARRQRRGPTTALPRHPWRARWPEPAPHELLEHGPAPEHPFDRSVERWLRAYPRRWRRVRGDEMRGLLADLAGSDAERLDVRTGLDLVRGGLATRWRTRPPLWRWFLYRSFDVRLPRQHRAWAHDDIDGALYGLRSWLGGSWWLLPLLLFIVRDPLAGPPFFWVFMASVVAVSTTNTAYRRTARLRHLEPKRGEPLLPGTLVPRSAPRRRVAARPVSVVVLGALTLLTVLSLATVALATSSIHVVVFPPDGTPGDLGGWETSTGPMAGRGVAVGLLVTAAVVGVLLMLAARRLTARVRTPDGIRTTPEQAVVRLSGAHGARAVVWTAVLATPLWFEVTGDHAMFWSVLLGSVCLALLPTAALAVRLARQVPWHTSALDVLAALRGRSRPVDDPELVFVPWGPEVWSSGPEPSPRPVT